MRRVCIILCKHVISDDSYFLHPFIWVQPTRVLYTEPFVHVNCNQLKSCIETESRSFWYNYLNSCVHSSSFWYGITSSSLVYRAVHFGFTSSSLVYRAVHLGITSSSLVYRAVHLGITSSSLVYRAVHLVILSSSLRVVYRAVLKDLFTEPFT